MKKNKERIEVWTMKGRECCGKSWQESGGTENGTKTIRTSQEELESEVVPGAERTL